MYKHTNEDADGIVFGIAVLIGIAVVVLVITGLWHLATSAVDAINLEATCRQYAQLYPDRDIRYLSQFGCVEKRGADWVILQFDLNRATETDSQ